MSGMLALAFAGDFDELEARAATLADGSAAAGADGARLLAAIAFGATLDEAFEPGAAAAAVARRAAGGDPDGETRAILDFAEAFNLAESGRPLAALDRLPPALSAGESASPWPALAEGLAGDVHRQLGDRRKAVTMTGEAAGALATRLAPDDALLLLARLWHAEALVEAGDPEAGTEVAQLIDDARARPVALPVLGLRLTHLAVAVAPGAEREALARLVFDIAMASLPPDHTGVGLALENRAFVSALQGDHAGEFEALSRAVAIYRGSLAADAPAVAGATMAMAMSAANLGAAGEAVRLADVALALTRSGTGGRSVATASRLVEAATVMTLAGDGRGALALIEEAKPLLRDNAEAGWQLAGLYLPMQEAKALIVAGRADEAAAVQARLLEELAGGPWAESYATAAVEAEHGLALGRGGRDGEALAAARRALAGLSALRLAQAGLAPPAIGEGASADATLRLAVRVLVASAWRMAAGKPE
jgi:tetratricopeptide (TPR) repeat protein